MSRTVQDVVNRQGPRRLLALDGGGMRGLITLQVLAEIEEIVRKQSEGRIQVLGDYFDFIAGTSTGSIIGTMLALGKSVAEVQREYLDFGPRIFSKDEVAKAVDSAAETLGIKDAAGGIGKAIKAFKIARAELTQKVMDAKERAAAAAKIEALPLKQRPFALYETDYYVSRLKEMVGESRPVTDPDLRCLLLLTLYNAHNDSPFIVTNNPRSPSADRMRRLTLWETVRASTAAPLVFEPEEIDMGDGRKVIFQDGALTGFNNPAFLLFLHATLPRYGLGWPTGNQSLLLVSVGTGLHPGETPGLRLEDVQPSEHIKHTLHGLFNNSIVVQDLTCRALGRCVAGQPLERANDPLEGELGDLIDASLVPGGGLFTYARYNAVLTREGLARIDCGDVDSARVSKTDSEDVEGLIKVGKAVARSMVKAEDFAPFAR